MTTLLAPGAKAISVKNIRQTHHRVAMLLAAGHREKEVAAKCGYTLAYLSVLKSTPAIKDLVAKYAEKIMANAIQDAAEEMQIGQSVLAMAQRQRLEQLEEADFTGEKVPLRELNKICADGEDRYGTPRKSTNFNLNANFAEELEKALARSAQVDSPAPAAAPIDVTPPPEYTIVTPEPKGLLPRPVAQTVTPFRRRV